MHIQDHARARPEADAVVMDDGRRMSWRALDNTSICIANALCDGGVRPGDTVALLMENRPEYLAAAWGAMRLGVYLVPINWHLKPDEIGYIVADADSVMLVHSGEMAALAQSVSHALPRIDIDGGAMREKLQHATETADALRPEYTETEGQIMYYSSGTTGRPKGIKRPLDGRAFGEPSPIDGFLAHNYAISEDTVYLSPAPQYHAAPLNFCMAILRFGGQIVVMTKFDAQRTLELIEAHRVTHAQFVPTMFVRMLKLLQAQRAVDTSSLEKVIHAAAPCPVDVKKQMMAWWGPILHEYYGGSEGNGVTGLGPEEWLSHPGSVGRAILGTIHICDDQGNELPTGETGTVYFSGMPDFEYHKDPEKTRKAYIRPGWSTMGDIGHLDEDGFLYLTDRAAHTIISGGVNVYPREIEDVLIGHPEIADVGVIGYPDEEFGEAVVAVVQLEDSIARSEARKTEIVDYCRSHLASYKCPRRVLFDEALPRMPNGKLIKHRIDVDTLIAADNSEQA